MTERTDLARHLKAGHALTAFWRLSRWPLGSLVHIHDQLHEVAKTNHEHEESS